MAAVRRFTSVLDLIEVIYKPIMGVRMLIGTHFKMVPTRCKQWTDHSAAHDTLLSITVKINCVVNVKMMILKDIRIKEHPFEPGQL
jgi:hypothetical protein